MAHVIIVTYPAQGHINPLLQFAKRLASKGLKATLATTPYTINSIHSSTVAIEPISDGFDDAGFNHSSGVESYLESFTTVGSSTLTQLIIKFRNSESPVTCIVYDSLMPWAGDVAKQLGLYSAVFLTNSASVCSLYWQIEMGLLTLPLKQENFPLSLPGIPSLNFCDLPSFLAFPDLQSHSAYLSLILEMFQFLNKNDWVFCNSFESLEIELVEAMGAIWPVEVVGPMVPSAYLDRQIDGDTSYGSNLWKPTASDQCLKWLDTKPPKSVIYVSFGSMADVSAKQIEELAMGLKTSGMVFLWVLKKDSEKKMLPVEFLSSVGDQIGRIVSWCNQVEVLAHEAIGCFVTHCGWNSMLEGLSLGVPMVAVAQWSDQPMNAKFMEEVWKVGVRAKKNDENGIVTRAEIHRCLREVMVGETSNGIRRNAWKWKDAAMKALSAGGSSDIKINQFVIKLMNKGKIFNNCI